jgi:sporulation protein YlmC with PRC-barrel domain
MADPRTATLRKLGDAGLTVADPSQDVRGKRVIDSWGEEVGKVDDLLLDDRERQVRFMRVASGGFLGIGGSHFLIPVEAIVAITDGEVRVNQARDRIAGSPRYDPDLADEGYWGELYGYYGYTPYWAPGYVPSTLPYHP